MTKKEKLIILLELKQTEVSFIKSQKRLKYFKIIDDIENFTNEYRYNEYLSSKVEVLQNLCDVLCIERK